VIAYLDDEAHSGHCLADSHDGEDVLKTWVFTALSVTVRLQDPRLAIAPDVMRTAIWRLLGLFLSPDLPLLNRDLCQ
jgi:hypothetical protein